MAIPCVVVQWDQAHTAFSVVNYNYNPTFLPVQGLEPNLEVLVKRTPFSIPEYDPRLKNLVTSFSISEDFDTENPSCRKWLTLYSLIDKTAAEKIIAVDEAENDANYMVFPIKKHLKYMALAIAILDRKASGLTITTAQQGILNKIQSKAQKIWVNHLLAISKRNDLNASQEVDIDEGWDNVDPEV